LLSISPVGCFGAFLYTAPASRGATREGQLKT
jgi:hypothetical protein